MPKQPLSDSSQSSRQGVSSTERQLLPTGRVVRRHALHGAEILRQAPATRRIDFVSELPFELVSSLILPDVLSLPYYHAFPYLQVCKTWRQRVLQSSQLHYKSFGQLTQGDMNLMVAYAPYLHKIEIGSPAPLPMNFFAKFTRLQSLSLTLPSQNDIHTLYLLLKPIEHALKELCILVSQSISSMEICLNEILQRFPNIEMFSSNHVNLTGLIAGPHHKVKKLELNSVKQPLGSQDVIALLERFPSLEHLVLPRCQDSSPLAIMDQYCPALVSLSYIMTDHPGPLLFGDPAINMAGFHTLNIAAGDNFNVQHLIPLLKAHCDTLVNFHLQGKINHQSKMTHLLPEQGVVFKQLNKLSFYPHEANDGNALVQWIFKRMPNASEIQVTEYNIDDKDVYEAMKHAKNLKSLSFTLPSPSLIHLLEYHGALGHQSTLNSVSIDINFSGEHSTRVLNAVARLSNLRRLFLQLRGAALGEEFVAFIENMARGCPSLEELTMESPIEFPPAIIAKFPLYPNLQELTLGSPNIWDECLLQLFKCPSLSALFIERENMQDHVAAELVQLTGEE
ncbi:hypothetical protein LRAMOSA08992 [Lichtheimia ramosa]|uniref:F-box domain-containing protein n=1 Tax=Lichtheimia ramosa TaxID=688394 RepID=A0A077WH22_9FUNG|nr:hypothetical protein LRAMOSA08992 [Lichtheimia ramosa]